MVTGLEIPPGPGLGGFFCPHSATGVAFGLFVPVHCGYNTGMAEQPQPAARGGRIAYRELTAYLEHVHGINADVVKLSFK